MFWSVFVGLCAKREVSPNAVAKALGLSSGSVTLWKNGAVPRATTIRKIADYFGVSPESFLAEADDPAIKKERPADGEALNVDEWIKKARTMSNGDLNLALRELLKIQAERIAEDERTEH